MSREPGVWDGLWTVRGRPPCCGGRPSTDGGDASRNDGKEAGAAPDAAGAESVVVLQPLGPEAEPGAAAAVAALKEEAPPPKPKRTKKERLESAAAVTKRVKHLGLGNCIVQKAA